MWHGREPEKWAEGIRLLDEWDYMDDPEPRMCHLFWMRTFEIIFKPLHIYHYRLGEKPG
jgi:hypothetical protein